MATTEYTTIVERGRYDWSSSGYTLREDGTVWSTGGTSAARGYDDLPEITGDVDGAWVVDKRPISADPEFPGQVYKAPLPELNPNRQPEPFGQYDGMLMASGWAPMLQAANGGTLCLDTVGVEGFAAYWRDCGARIGRMVDGAIVWENGAA